MRAIRYHGWIVPTRRAGSLGLSAVLALSWGAAGCTRPDATPPVATVTLSASKTRLTPDSPVDFTFQFDVAPSARIEGDYRVFIQVVDSDGNGTSWNDDHAPTIPTSEWKPGQTIKYTRTSFVPMTPHLGEVAVEIGLYKGQLRLPLQTLPPVGKPPRTRAYRVGTLQLVPATEGNNYFLVRRSGWNNVETPPNMEWTWTQKAAIFGLETNPRRDVTLYLQFDARPDVFEGKPQDVTVSLGNDAVDHFVADSPNLTLRRIPISAAQLGTSDPPPQFKIEVDRTFSPARVAGGGKDTRELGLRVFHYFVEAR